MARKIARRQLTEETDPETALDACHPPEPMPARREHEVLVPVDSTHGRFFQTHHDRAFVGIDPSLTGTGIAVVSATGEWNTWRLKPKSNGVQRLDEIEAKCEQIFDNIHHAVGNLGAAVIEGYGFGTSNNREFLGEAGGVVKLAWYRSCRRFKRKPPFVPATPQQLKKFATGSGGSEVKKQQVLLATYKRWGVEFSDDNACDAFVLAQVARTWALGAIEDGTKAQAEVIAKLPQYESLLP